MRQNDKNLKRTCMRWTFEEDAVLVSSLVDLVNMGGWKQDNGQFKAGYQLQIEKMLKAKIPNCQKLANPHIESRVKSLRGKYHAIAEMRGPKCSGFGWNEKDKCITCDSDVWINWVKSHSEAVGLRNKPFPFYDELDYIYGKDRATGEDAENAADALEEIDRQEQEHQGQNDSIPPFVFGDMGCDQEVTSPTSQIPLPMGNSTQDAPSSSGNKKRKVDTTEVIHQFSNHMDKLGTIMAAAGEHIGRLADCFSHEQEGVQRRMAVNNELMKIEGLNHIAIIKVGRKIALDPMETDYFFSLPEDYRKTYVLSLLIPDNS